MNTSLLKQTITLIGILLTGLFSLLSVPEAHYPVIEIGQWKISPSLYSVPITHNQRPEAFYKVSPYDDVIFYEDGTWDKVLHGNEQILNDNLVNPSFLNKKIVWPLRTLLKKPKVGFVSTTKGISYQSYEDKDKLVIKKKITDLPKKVVGFGNAFVFSKDDEIFDAEGKQYSLSDFKEDRTEISGINGLFFKNPANTGQIFLPLAPAQKVIIDKIYRLVEVETVFPEAVWEINVVQEILFEENSYK